jgi:hypothetical protein
VSAHAPQHAHVADAVYELADMRPAHLMLASSCMQRGTGLPLALVYIVLLFLLWLLLTGIMHGVSVIAHLEFVSVASHEIAAVPTTQLVLTLPC